MMNERSTITFETKCWENDWEYLLKEGYLDHKIKNCNCLFDRKVLYINNVRDLSKVIYYAQLKIAEGIIDEFIVVDDYADEALAFFQIDKDNFGRGYYYSIAELVSIYLCSTDLLLHFSSDSCLDNNQQWVHDAAKLLMSSSDYFVANPTWNGNFMEAKTESISEIED